MKRGLFSLAALSLVCVGFASDTIFEPAKFEVPRNMPVQSSAPTKNYGTVGGLLQEQFFGTDQATKNSGFFRTRRARLIYNYVGDEKTTAKLMVEFASGSNQTTAQVRDAYVQYRPNGTKEVSGPTFMIGAQNMPLGYEINYSTANMLWLERSVYEQTFFNSEAGKGFLYQNGDASNYWFVGAFDSLTVNDPEQVDQTTKGEVLPVGGVRMKHGAFEGGLSGMAGKRPSYVSGAVNLASTDRRFFYADLRWHPENSKLDVRSEYMIGKDRVPLAAAAGANPTSGGHVNIDYHFTPTDTFIGRYEMFDRNTDVSGDLQTLYGLAFAKELASNLRVTLGTDWNKNPNNAAGQRSYRTITFRVQLKF